MASKRSVKTFRKSSNSVRIASSRWRCSLRFTGMSNSTAFWKCVRECVFLIRSSALPGSITNLPQLMSLRAPGCIWEVALRPFVRVPTNPRSFASSCWTTARRARKEPRRFGKRSRRTSSTPTTYVLFWLEIFYRHWNRFQLAFLLFRRCEAWVLTDIC